jgi:GMP synthase (glutamine-hydrolysing)
MSNILIIKLDTTNQALKKRHGDFEDWVISGMGADRSQAQIVDVVQGDKLPAPGLFSGVIVMGSQAMVTDYEEWSERTASWIPAVIQAGIPILGICYGHQLLAHALGGLVGPNPYGGEFGSVDVKLLEPAQSDLLFQTLPPIIRVQTYHHQSVIELPKGATLLASSDKDPNHAFSIGGTAWGVQFHPEMDAEITRYLIEKNSRVLEDQGLKPSNLLGKTVDTPYGKMILTRFMQIIEKSL